MGKIRKAKEDKNAYKPKSKNTKFIVIGVIAAIIAVAAAAVLTADMGEPNTRMSLDTSKGSPALGSASAPVTIIEFGDYQCPFCQRWNQNTKPLIEENYINTGKAKLIFVDFPIIGQDSITAHMGSYCADEQGLYWEYHDYLYANQGHENDGWASSGSLKSLVSDIGGMNEAEFSQCLDSGKYENRVIENRNIASKSGASSTPSFIIIGPEGTGTQVTGAQPYGAFAKVIDEKMAT